MTALCQGNKDVEFFFQKNPTIYNSKVFPYKIHYYGKH